MRSLNNCYTNSVLKECHVSGIQCTIFLEESFYFTTVIDLLLHIPKNNERAQIISAAWIKLLFVEPCLEFGQLERKYHIVKINVFSVSS
jgi:hypothetical protein